jgi:hypothetical protein
MSELTSKEIDICERLRRGFGGLAPPVCDEAANEIERLRLELAENKRINMDHKLSLDIIARAAHEPEASKPQFMECDACRAKAGSPTLCAGCLHNRRVIGQLSAPPVSPTARRCACDPLPPVRELWRVLPDELQGVANAALTAVLEHRCPDESDAYDPPRCAHAVPTDPANPCRGGLFHDFSRASPPPPPEHPLSSGDAIACIAFALQDPDTDQWPQLLRDCMHVIERMEGELLDAKRQRNAEVKLRQAAERAAQEYTFCGWISPNPGCTELVGHDYGGLEPAYSRSTKISEQP